MTRTPRSRMLIALLCLVGAAQATNSDAGLSDMLKQKAKEKAEKAAPKATEQPKAPSTTTSPVPATTEAADEAAAKDDGAVSGVSTKFDFVPGDQVLFTDDFTQDELGEFPARWKLAKGTFEVAEQAGERWLRSIATVSNIRMKVPPSLPEFWTLEFDATRLDAAGNVLTVTGLSATGTTVWEVIFPYGGLNLYCEAGTITSDTPFEGAIPGRHRIMLMARGTALKVYVDRDRLANIPDITEKGVAAEIDFQLWSNQKPMMTNVRFAEGCKPAKDELAAGKLVTYGIRFATGSDVVLPESAPVLRQVSGYLGQHPEVRLTVTGHTDNVGSAASNLDLSKRRAAAVARVLSEEFGVAASRFATDGKGDTQALASNAKPEGRAMNRRVEFSKQ